MGTYSNLFKVKEEDILSFLHPVGSIFKTYDANFNPNTTWGGTWSKIEDRFLYGIENGDITTGGASSTSLSISNLPSHNHSFTPSGSISVTTNPTFSGDEATGSFYGYNYGNDSGTTYPFTRVTSTIWDVMGSGSSIGNASYTCTLNPSGTISGGSYSFIGSATITGSKGEGTSFNISPPYQAVYIWKRTA